MVSPATHRLPRLGLIGCGYVSKYHIAASAAVGTPLAAVCDRKPDAARALADRLNARCFDTPADLFRSGAVDAVVIATPHLQHVELAIAAVRAGLHVFIEKPLAVSASEACRLFAVLDQHPSRVCAVNFNHRAWPLWREIRKLIHENHIGDVVRFEWTITDWFRTQWYYEQSAWRGTWAGEGGGILVNQCPHQLDMLGWLFGAPERVVADVRFGKHHHLDVEDEVHALLHYPAGHTGCFIASTGEPCGVNRLDIVGDLGLLRIESETAYHFTQFATSARQHIHTNQTRNDPPAHTSRQVVVADHEDEYVVMIQNFIQACAGNAAPIASARDALQSIELANAILLSGVSGRAVSMPPDQAAFDALLEDKQRAELSGGGDA
jgi:predicted dehydrogenase